MTGIFKDALALKNKMFRFGLASVPLVMFVMYLVIFGVYSHYLKIPELFGMVEFSNVGATLATVEEAMYRNFWGVALIIASAANTVLIAFALFLLFTIKLKEKVSTYLMFFISLFGVVLWLLINFGDLGGGIAEQIYTVIDKVIEEFDSKPLIYFEDIIDVTVANGYLGVYIAAVLLSKLCLAALSASAEKAHYYLKMYHFLFLITAVFLSLSILQMFLQYQWFNVFMVLPQDSKNSLHIVTFGFPMVMSVFYVAMFITLFFPAEVILKNIAQAQMDTKKVNEATAVRKNVGLNVGYTRLKSFLLFFSPLLTALVAEIVKVNVQS